MKIYTGFGDKGKTKLYGGQVVNKDHLRVEVYGTLDELNSWLGLIISGQKASAIQQNLIKIQNDIFTISSEIATPDIEKRSQLLQNLKEINHRFLEKCIDEIEKQLEPLKNFILPGGTILSSYYHIARTICRRAERQIVTLNQIEAIEDTILIYINRLSDLLFILARLANKNEAKADVIWQSR